MPSLRNFWKELALIDIDLISLKIPRFYGQNDEFTTWFSKVEQAFDCRNLSDQEKFKVVISKLRGCALQWWKNYKFKRRKKGKEKVRTEKLLTACKSTFQLLSFAFWFPQALERVLSDCSFPWKLVKGLHTIKGSLGLSKKDR